tara:strand:+ start:258 stop:881 length:624 start_codon:yes stop_codon:yes gene_type:complete
MPVSFYKDTPNNRKLGRVGEKLGDPKFKTSTKPAAGPKKAPVKAPAKASAKAPAKAPAKKLMKNILNDLDIQLLISYWQYVTLSPGEAWNFDKIDPDDFEVEAGTILQPYVIGQDEDGNNKFKNEGKLLKSFDKLVQLLNELEDKGLSLKDLGEEDQKKIRSAQRVKKKIPLKIKTNGDKKQFKLPKDKEKLKKLKEETKKLKSMIK